MKSIEFIYWLQGYFELTNSNHLNVKQIKLIKNHLKMVDLIDKENKFFFCIWLDGFLYNYKNEITEENTKKIKEKLNKLFEHII